MINASHKNEEDDLLDLFRSAEPSMPDVPAPVVPAREVLPLASEVTLITVNYFENDLKKETWLKAQHAFALQFFNMTEPFCPSKQFATNNAFAQLHRPDFWIGYIEHYKAENEGSRPIPTEEQTRFYKDIFNETMGMPRRGHGPLLGQVYDHKGGGTNYYWGAVARMLVNTYDELKLELFLECQRFALIDVGIPNTDGTPKTTNVKFRGRYDPRRLWRPRGRR